MATMTAKKPKAKKPEVVPVDLTIKEEDHKKAVEKLQAQCMEMQFSISWLPQAKKAGSALKATMAATVDGEAKGFSISKRLFASDHPAIKELNAARKRIIDWRDSMTIVKAADVGLSMDKEVPKIEPGVRLILRSDIDDFDKGFQLRCEQLMTAADKVQAAMPDIRKMDKERLGQTYSASDYPDDVRNSIRITQPRYRDIQVSIHLPKQIYERECQRISRIMDQTVEVAVQDLCGLLMESFSTLANSIVNRTRVYPKSNDPEYARFHMAEVVQQKAAGEGRILVQLRISADKELDRKTTLEWVGPISEEEFASRFKPGSTNEKKKITTSVVEHIFGELKNFTKLKEMLGTHGDRIDETLDKVRELLAKAGGDSEKVCNDLRASEFFRNELSATLTTAIGQLAESVEDVQKVRRKINTNLFDFSK